MNRIALITPFLIAALPTAALAQCEDLRIEEPGSSVYALSTALEGDRAVVGALDAAYVYERVAGVWNLDAMLLPDPAPANQGFGVDVALDGDRVIVAALIDGGGPQGSNTGSVYVYDKGPQGWALSTKLYASDGYNGQQFGRDVALDGNWAAVGATPDLGGGDPGSAYVFRFDGVSWQQDAKLVPSDGAAGDLFGYALDLSGRTVVVGSRLHDAPGSCTSGSAYVYERRAGVWVETQILVGSHTDSFDQFGISIDIEGDRALVGAFHESAERAESGAVYLFERSAGVWTQTQRLLPPGPVSFGRFGQSLALGAGRIYARSLRRVHVFEEALAWKQTRRYLGGPSQFFGQTIAVSGNEALISNTTNTANNDPGSARLFTHDTLVQPFCECDTGYACADDDAGCAGPSGRGAAISVCGSTSVTRDDLLLSVTTLPSQSTVIFLVGEVGSPQTFGNGLTCIAAPRFAFAPALASNGFSRLGPGLAAFSQANFPPAGQLLPGRTLAFQASFNISRPECGGGLQLVPRGFSISNATAVTFVP